MTEPAQGEEHGQTDIDRCVLVDASEITPLFMESRAVSTVSVPRVGWPSGVHFHHVARIIETGRVRPTKEVVECMPFTEVQTTPFWNAAKRAWKPTKPNLRPILLPIQHNG